MANRPTVCIAVLTYRRNDQLAELLPVLADVADDPTLTDHDVDVLVVDNDPAGGAGAVVAAAAGAVRYVHEPVPGIAAARNRALDAAADHDYLVFLDDDERPEPGWLPALLRTRAAAGAAAVAGKVRSDFGGAVHPWVQAGAFLDRRHRDAVATGARIDTAATNNLLLDLAAVRRLGVRFDERFGLSGGEDTLFTRTLVTRGGVLVWCREAVVVDRVPAARVSSRWLLARAFAGGVTEVRVAVVLATSPAGRLRARVDGLIGGGARVVVGGLRWLRGRVHGSVAERARALASCCRGAGMVAACVGYVSRPYARSGSASGPARPVEPLRSAS